MKNRNAVSALTATLAFTMAVRGLFADTSFSYTSGNYTQDFNSLWTNTTTPPVNLEPGLTPIQINSANGVAVDLTGPSADFATTIPQISNMNGWWAINQGGQNKPLNYTIDNGSNGTAALTAFFDPGQQGAGNNLALGVTAAAETGFVTFGVKLINNSTGSLNAISLSYTGELFHQDTGQKSLSFGYLVDPSGNLAIPTAGTTGFGTLNVGGFATGLPATANSTQTLSVINLPLSTTWGVGQALWLTWQMGQGGGGQGLGIDNLTFSGSSIAASPTLIWAIGSGTWDTSTPNWTGGTTSTFTSGSNNAAFGTIATNTTVTVAPGGVSAASSVTITNTGAGAYTFAGGPIGGAAVSLNLSSGTVILTSANSYGLATNINGGTLIVDNDTELGSQGTTVGALLNINGGTLKLANTYTSTKRPLTVTSVGGTINTNGSNASFAGSSTVQVNIKGVLVKTGAGDLNLGLQPRFGSLALPAGGLDIEGGSVTFLGNGRSNPIDMYNGGIFNGNLIIKNSSRVNFNSGNFTGTGEIQIQSGSKWAVNTGGTGQLSDGTATTGNVPAGVLISAASGTLAGNIAINIHLNTLEGTDGNHPAFTRTDVTNPAFYSGNVVPAGNFMTVIGGTKAVNPGIGPTFSNLTISGVISGNSDINVGNDYKSGGSGNLHLAAQNTYHGVTMLNGGGTGLPVLYIDVNNALPTDTDVVFGTLAGAGTPTIDLNGHNQTIRSLSVALAANSPNLNAINNSGATPSTLTISGSITPYYPFNGQINDMGPTLTDSVGNPTTFGGSTTAVVKDGTSTFRLGQYLDSSGHYTLSTYSGGTTARGGILVIPWDGALGAATGSLTFDGGTIAVKAPDLQYANPLTNETSITWNTSRPITVTANGGTIQTPTFNAIDASSGSHALVASVILTGNGGYNWGGTLHFSGDAGSAVTLNGGTGNVTITGVPAVQIDANVTLTADGATDPFTDTLTPTKHVAVIANGAFLVPSGSKAIGKLSGSGSVQVSAGATLSTSQIDPVALTVNGTTVIRPNTSLTNRTSTVQSLTLAGTPGAWTGKLNLTNNNLIVPGGTNVQGQIKQAANLGAWNGTGGITSSSAQAAATGSTATALGYASGTDYTAGNGRTSFDGHTFAPTDSLVMYTLAGDANLDSSVTFADFLQLQNNYNQNSTNWERGDWNYDGSTTFADFLILQNNYNKVLSVGNLQSGAATVPEPGSLAMLGLGVASLLIRHRNRHGKRSA